MVGIVVTTFLSNDATAVVLTLVVAAAVKAAKVEKPLPYLLICAFVANAASFVLPISNPANLVIYGNNMPSLQDWLRQFLLPSICAITVTYFMLRLTQPSSLNKKINENIIEQNLSTGGKTALFGIAATTLILLASSAVNIQLGLPTAITGVITSAIVLFSGKKNPLIILKGVSLAVLPLVAGLFVIVEALNKTGMIENLTSLLNQNLLQSQTKAAWLSGSAIAIACNLTNNLPAGLITGNILQSGNFPEMVKSAVVVGVDLGPNFSITG